MSDTARRAIASVFKRASWAACRQSFVIGLLVLGGCIVGPDYHAPLVSMPVSFASTSSTQPADTSSPSADLSRWWLAFDDMELQSLLGRAFNANLDMRAAEFRLVEARSQLGVQQASFYPAANFTGSYTRQQISKNGFFTPGGTSGSSSIPSSELSHLGLKQRNDLYQVGFDASWELDLFGGVRRGIQAAGADAEAAVEDRRSVMVSLLGDVARYYVQYRGLQRQIAITQQNIRADEDTLEVTRTQFQKGLTSYLDVARAESQLRTSEAQLPAQDTSLKQAMYQLGVLLGADPASLSEELATPAPIPTPRRRVPQGLPSDLLRRRPDVRQAERQLAAATARIGVAVADLYPKFSLTGQFGQQSLRLSALANSASTIWSFGPGVSWDLFDAGRVRSTIDVYNARQQQALINYKQKILLSLQDVDNALTAHANEQRRNVSLVQAVKSSQDAFDLASSQYVGGLTPFLNVLDAQRTLHAAQDQLAQSDTAVASDLVALYKALGGGWDWKFVEQNASNH